jgi:hypothetical protein
MPTEYVASTFSGTRLIARSARQSLEIIDPRYGRAAPDLPHRPEPVALTNTAPANSPIVGATLAACKKRGTALPAKMLKARAAVVTGFCVDFGSVAGHPDVLRRADYRYPVGRAGQRLTIRTVTDRNPCRINVGRVSHAATMALPVYVHRSPHWLHRPNIKKRRPKAPFYHFVIGSFSAPSGRRPLHPWRPA